VMHVARALRAPAVVIWGPTSPAVYGYDDQIHLRGRVESCPLRNECLGTRFPDNYGSMCPRPDSHCMNSVPVESVISSIRGVSAPMQTGVTP